jgi:hypothetical protein
MPDAAPWLTAMENGGLGEARARAFLMERFWVLERSVDVEGADYLIQRRLTPTNFLEREPPRLGVVQVKFIQDGNTYIKVHKSYVTDRHGAAYGEFFLIVFTGREDEQRAFLLSSNDMLREFEEIDEDGTTFLRIRGAKLIDANTYEIVQRKLALDRIEHALKNADFFANRQFLSHRSYVKISADQIDHDLTLPLQNWWGNIPKEFFKGKRKLQSTLFDLQEITEALQKILIATDPEEAQRIYEEEITDYIGRSGYHDTLQVPLEFFDEDFFATVKNHRARIAKLNELGVAGNYLALIDAYDASVFARLMELADDPAINSAKILVTYQKMTLANPGIEVIGLPDKLNDAQVVSSEKGYQTVIGPLPKEVREAESETDRAAKLRTWLRTFSQPFQRALDTLYLGTDLVQ